jgi:hypothetical protein
MIGYGSLIFLSKGWDSEVVIFGGSVFFYRNSRYLGSLNFAEFGVFC